MLTIFLFSFPKISFIYKNVLQQFSNAAAFSGGFYVNLALEFLIFFIRFFNSHLLYLLRLLGLQIVTHHAIPQSQLVHNLQYIFAKFCLCRHLFIPAILSTLRQACYYLQFGIDYNIIAIRYEAGAFIPQIQHHRFE